MKRFYVGLLALTVFSAGILYGLPVLTVEGGGTTGGYLKVKVTGVYHPGAEYAELRNGSDKILSENALFHPPNGGDNELYALLGVPNSLETGIYKVTLSSASGSLVESRLITLRSLEYRSETINLNESLSNLRRTDDKRRVEEAKRLWELTNQSNTDSLFHFGPFIVPVKDGIVTSYFGDRRLFIYIDVRSERSVHSGIDLAAPMGTPVQSSGGGRVVLATNRLITGNTVVIEHLPGVYSLYYHLDEIRVDSGMVVAEGGIIGTLGASGLATGPHLHWEFRIGGVPIDPSFMAEFAF